ncbi:hypothetical protein C0995_013772 [Termitomyces sp. Mi166|nr:hypothetical protein C0995_013772 [Termitomyces sp. Mi166\
MAEFVTKSIDNLSHGLTVKKAMESLGLKECVVLADLGLPTQKKYSAKDLLPGMEVRLLGHQAVGVAWMVAKEESSDRGGILADDMGLGKTVQMIATMVKNQASLDEEHRTTLIVVPAALLNQAEEVETKTNGVFTVHLHHGKDKLKYYKLTRTEQKISQIKQYDVIVTTYQTLNQDFFIPKDVEPSEEAEWLAGNGSGVSGILAHAKFYRAVADEAQFIRNRATRSSVSLAHVKAKYRWMLTGTPVTNTLADIYGLLRFGRFRPWNDWMTFDKHVAKVQFLDAPLAGSRAQAILQPILLRRTKNSTLEGKPILQLPKKDIDIVKLEFSRDERDSQTEGYEDPTLLVASDSDKELARAKKVMGGAWVAEVKKRSLLRRRASELLDFSDEAETAEACCPVCQEFFMNDNGRVLSCTHEICFDCLLNLQNAAIAHDGIFGQGNEKENLEAEKEYETGAAKGYRPCPTCKKMTDLTLNKIFKSSAFEPTDEELTKHAQEIRRSNGARRISRRDVKIRSPFPKASFEDRGLDDSDDDLPDVSTILDERPIKRQKKSQIVESDDDDVTDLAIDQVYKPLKDVKMSSTSDSEIEFIDSIDKEMSRESSISPKGKEKHKTPSKKRGRDDEDRPLDAVIATWSRGDDELEPSTKMLALIDLLQEWEATGDKTIVYSQWTSMLDLIDVLLSRHGIQSLRFDGKMDRIARDRVLSAFKKPGGPKVILISTKSGSVGLNLVSANRIINMDLSWNYAAESQAYDRLVEKEVVIKRLVVDNTIEERMLRLQDVKTGLAEAALGEGSGAKLHKLSVRDIKYLFGMTSAVTPTAANGQAQAQGSSP